MIIKDFFEKSIDRNIETVIKADDNQNIANEVAEYVITNEIAKKISDLFGAYNNAGSANGVWISGFFGSGKSHLLKILSYILENKEIEGYKTGELFAEKIENDGILKGDILAAVKIPSESILFNIDQQAQITSKADENAILSVFYKVFYDHLGYYGFQSHVAEFEVWLTNNKQYDAFKSQFQTAFGKPWQDARMDYFDPLVTETIAKVLGQLNNTASSKYDTILDEIEDRSKQSIENFCLNVFTYIKSKPTGFRLNFFVDEVGQYISDNTKLMLNLQTIAETLATKTQGKSWLLVTSQEDMEKVVGDMNKSQQNDFSRIQARFKIKVPLTSANVDEVIEKRLLKKKDTAQKHLVNSFATEKSRLETLLSFSEAGVQFKGYKDANDFANKLPFVPYQFDLFQQCRKSLASHNAFQGKHASVGERSMLSVFQKVVLEIELKDEQNLISFDQMFGGIRNELKGEIQNSITLAEKQLDSKFALRILKMLFLVKYFNNFKTTKRNIAVLMLDHTKMDLVQHDKNISEALNLLENQSYIQRNGEFYEFLTDEEKDVEQEIKNTDVDDKLVLETTKELFFDEIIKENRIKFIDNKQDYEFTSKIDGSILGREKELTIEIITDNFPDFDSEQLIAAGTMGSPIVRLLLKSDSLFNKDLKMFLKTKKYIQQTSSTTNSTEVKRILHEKSSLNTERRRNLVIMANKNLVASTVIIAGAKVEMGVAGDGKMKVINAFQLLIKSAYNNLRMLGSLQYSEETIKNILFAPFDDLFKTDDITISEAENEILNCIKRRKQQSDRTSLADLRTIFAKRPYGWYQNAIFSLVAKLHRRSKVELKKDANLLENSAVLESFMNTNYYSNTIVEVQSDIDQRFVIALKICYAEAFDETCSFTEAKEVGTAFKEKLKNLSAETKSILTRKYEFPFVENLINFSEKLEGLAKKDYIYFLTNLKDFEDELLDGKSDLVDPIKKFINSDQANIYSEIKKIVEGDHSNFQFIEKDEINVLQALIKSEKPYQGSQIQEAKKAKDILLQKIEDLTRAEKEKAINEIDRVMELIKAKPEFISLDTQKQKAILQPFTEEIGKLANQKYLSIIRETNTNASAKLLPEQLNEIGRFTNETKSESPNVVNDPPVEYISKSKIHIKFEKAELETANDVTAYTEELKKAYLQYIAKNKRITL